MFRFFGLRKRGRKAVAATRAGETYSEALLAGWVPPPQGAAPTAAAEPAQQEPPDDAVLERFYRNQR
jgi:hypothetical protein